MVAPNSIRSRRKAKAGNRAAPEAIPSGRAATAINRQTNKNRDADRQKGGTKSRRPLARVGPRARGENGARKTVPTPVKSRVSLPNAAARDATDGIRPWFHLSPLPRPWRRLSRYSPSDKSSGPIHRGTSRRFLQEARSMRCLQSGGATEGMSPRRPSVSGAVPSEIRRFRAMATPCSCATLPFCSSPCPVR